MSDLRWTRGFWEGVIAGAVISFALTSLILMAVNG